MKLTILYAVIIFVGSFFTFSRMVGGLESAIPVLALALGSFGIGTQLWRGNEHNIVPE